MIIRWTPTALADLQQVHAYIGADNPEAAVESVDEILAAIEMLQQHPELGHRGRVPRTRELVVGRYIVAYRIHRDAVELLGILHSARRWPDSFRPRGKR